MKTYVIKTNNGRYMHTYYVYEDENYAFGKLNEAKIYSDIESANDEAKFIKRYCNVECKAVECELIDTTEHAECEE